MTIRLFDSNSHMNKFQAVVISCEPCKDKWDVVLDKTAFFPEGGGQFGDTGRLCDVNALDTQIKDGIIHHYTDAPLKSGIEVSGELDWQTRFRRMQNHSGEHIISGIVHRRFGYDNVGFHLGSDDMTVDFNGPISREELNTIEREANEYVWANLPIHAWYPENNELSKLNYRSKLELTENIRLVEIAGVDLCACCAPHVSLTGEIGIIKILDSMRWKGGVRIHVACGVSALEDYCDKYENISAIASSLSVKQFDSAKAVSRINNELDNLRHDIAQLRKENAKLLAQTITPTDGNLVLSVDGCDTDSMRELANSLLNKCRICVVLSGADGNWHYIAASRMINLKAAAAVLNQALNGKGGGSSEMIQGSFTADRFKIEEYFAGFDI